MKLTIKGMGTVLPTEMGQHCDTAELPNYVPPRKLRRVDHFTRMTLLAAYRALENAGTLETLPTDMGIILSTGYGPSKTTFDFLDSIIEDGASLASPLAFSHSVHNIPAGVLSLILDAPCPQTTICQLRNPVIQGLYTAYLWLKEGRVDSVLFGAIDETTPLLEENMNRLSLSSPPDEGAAFFLLNIKDDGVALIQDTDSPKFTPQYHRYKTPISLALSLAESINAIKGTQNNRILNEGKIFIQVKGAPRD